MCHLPCILISDDLGEWVAKPPQIGEPRVAPTFEKDLVAGDGSILGKGAYGVTRLSKSSFTGEYYAVRASFCAPMFGFFEDKLLGVTSTYVEWDLFSIKLPALSLAVRKYSLA